MLGRETEVVLRSAPRPVLVEVWGRYLGLRWQDGGRELPIARPDAFSGDEGLISCHCEPMVRRGCDEDSQRGAGGAGWSRSRVDQGNAVAGRVARMYADLADDLVPLIEPACDLAYLSRLWQVVARRIQKQKSPCEIYKESDMVTRTIRDIFTEDIGTIWVDEKGAYEAAKEFMEAVMPRFANRRTELTV